MVVDSKNIYKKIPNKKIIEFKEKFYPEPGLESGHLAFRANCLTN